MGIAEALEAMSEAVRADASKARAKGVPATARLVEGLRCEVTSPRGDKMHTDMPPPMGGAGGASNPGWYMRGAAGFSGLRFKVRLGARGVARERLEELARWGDAHSVVGCTVRKLPRVTLDIDIA